MTQSFDENVNNNDDSPRTGVTGNTENILENSTIGTSTTADKNQGQDEHQNQKLDINSPEFEVLRAELAKLYQKNSTQEQHKVFEIIDIVKKGDTDSQEFKEAKEELGNLYQGRLSTLTDNEVLRASELVDIMQKNDINSQEFKNAKKELTNVYQKKIFQEQERGKELENIMHENGILLASSSEINFTKISLLSIPKERWIIPLPKVSPEEEQKGTTFEEKIEELGLEEKLKQLGFEKGDDGRWYHTNRNYYKKPLEPTDVIYIFERNQNGDPIDTGFGPKAQLEDMYIHSQDFDNKEYEFIDPKSLRGKEGEEISVKKLASGTFCILPAGTLIFTTEGIVEVKSEQLVNIEEDINSMNVINLIDVPKMYQADGTQPASTNMFELIKEFVDRVNEDTYEPLKKMVLELANEGTFDEINKQITNIENEYKNGGEKKEALLKLVRKEFSDNIKKEIKNADKKEVENYFRKTETQEELNRILNVFTFINRGVALCKITCEKAPETLQEMYKVATKIAGDLDERYLSRIDVTNFDSAIEQAEKIMLEIKNDRTLSEEYRNLAITSIMVKLLPKTNAHQHLKGSVPKEVILELAKGKYLEKKKRLEKKLEIAIRENYSKVKIRKIRKQLENLKKASIENNRHIKKAYNIGKKGFESLHKFNEYYSVISKEIRTKEDYEKSIQGIVNEALRQGQIIVEIRSSCNNILENGIRCTPERGAEILINAIQKAKNECIRKNITPPKFGLVFLSSRRRTQHSLEVAKIHAQLAVNSAEKYPDMKFGFDIAGPEDIGYPPDSFREAIDIIKSYNNDPKRNGHSVGITMHAGETPTFNNTDEGYNEEEGFKAVLQTIILGVNRIGHGLQAINGPDELILKKILELGIIIEICGVCNISTIPKNTAGNELHPLQKFLAMGLLVTICTDNDALCGTNITKEYLMFLMTGHSNMMDWNALKKIVRTGIHAAFIPDDDKDEASALLEDRIKQIQALYNRVMNSPK